MTKIVRIRTCFFRNHDLKVQVWAAISARRATDLQIFEDNLKGSQYVEPLKKGKKDMDRLYPEGYFFQQDGSGVHQFKGAHKYTRDEFEYDLVEWPP
jgi:hypothetical protein